MRRFFFEKRFFVQKFNLDFLRKPTPRQKNNEQSNLKFKKWGG